MAICVRFEMDIIVNSISTLNEGIRDASNYYHNILTCLGYPSNHAPVADLLRRYHKLDGHWLIASPIHWQATHNDAMIMACDEALDLPDAESRRWFEALTAFLVNDEVTLFYHDAYTWLIKFDECPPIHAQPVHVLIQQSMMQQLQALDSSLFWSRFLTENQMFFSEHALNKARAGRYPINGVWIWGGGELNVRGTRPLVCGDEVACDLARLLSMNVSRYQPNQRYPKDAIALFSSFEEEQACQFEKNTVHWYWKNTAYITKSKGWLARFIDWALDKRT